jgi:5-methyltetrahydropteroyltriglutamate--homocysteine methyltransferase
VPAIDRAVEGVGGTTALHLCFGYAARVKEKPSSYSFLPELAASKVDQISIEAAEPKVDCGILARLPDKQIILGVLDLGDMTVETPVCVAERIRRALAYVAPDCGLKYLPREVAFGKLAAMVAGAALVRRELGG